MLEGFAILDGAASCGRRRRAAVRVDPARGGRDHRARPAAPASATGDRSPLPGPRLGRRARRAARGRPRGVVRLHRPRHAVVGLPLRRDAPARPRCGRPRRARSRCPRCTPGRWSTPPPTAPTVRMFVLAPTKEPDRPRPTVLYGYGGFGVPLTPGYSAGRAGLGRGRRRLRGRQPARRLARRARSGTATACASNKQNVFDDFHAAAERLVADGWTTPRAARRSPAAPTAGCWSAPR